MRSFLFSILFTLASIVSFPAIATDSVLSVSQQREAKTFFSALGVLHYCSVSVFGGEKFERKGYAEYNKFARRMRDRSLTSQAAADAYAEIFHIFHRKGREKQLIVFKDNRQITVVVDSLQQCNELYDNLPSPPSREKQASVRLPLVFDTQQTREIRPDLTDIRRLPLTQINTYSQAASIVGVLIRCNRIHENSKTRGPFDLSARRYYTQIRDNFIDRRIFWSGSRFYHGISRISFNTGTLIIADGKELSIRTIVSREGCDEVVKLFPELPTTPIGQPS